jgi:hypothetical protein
VALLTKPQIQPTVGTAPQGTSVKTSAAFVTTYKLLSGLVLYLQSYLTKVYNAVVPSQFNPVSVTSAQSPYNIALTDEFIRAQAGTYILPPATGSGRTIIFFNVDGGTVNIVPNGSDTLNGSGTISFATQYEMVQVVDGASGAWSYWSAT